MMVVQLGGAFGAAEAAATLISSGEMELTLEVEVGGNPVSVVAHLIDPGDDQTTTTLAHQGGGLYSGVTVTERADLVVVFEAVGVGNDSIMSRPVRLTELGLDPDVLIDPSIASTEEIDGLTLDAATERWGWAAVALGAAALSLLAWWALGEYPRRRRRPDEVDQV